MTHLVDWQMTCGKTCTTVHHCARPKYKNRSLTGVKLHLALWRSITLYLFEITTGEKPQFLLFEWHRHTEYPEMCLLLRLCKPHTRTLAMTHPCLKSNTSWNKLQPFYSQNDTLKKMWIKTTTILLFLTMHILQCILMTIPIYAPQLQKLFQDLSKISKHPKYIEIQCCTLPWVLTSTSLDAWQVCLHPVPVIHGAQLSEYQPEWVIIRQTPWGTCCAPQ